MRIEINEADFYVSEKHLKYNIRNENLQSTFYFLLNIVKLSTRLA